MGEYAQYLADDAQEKYFKVPENLSQEDKRLFGEAVGLLRQALPVVEEWQYVKSEDLLDHTNPKDTLNIVRPRSKSLLDLLLAIVQEPTPANGGWHC